ncbi:hypothetical protein S7711_01875 [Stachybotrys chartarum IBT 7711]|uniref:Uncharacterized protein n=1 Tax=Stachybotrys chartarum (strain CBS 109288 / IBT 7711) TaxID=1280523 RepID=A0A084AMQ2_STACB|nr:hypothetical protein S7711_01875 [Stachybotrys chartarum IBT 7711]KFA48834.1 hypothetical protein S40293_01603 [Stachybotrys chartarum IBT 40293]KFA77084.1 hypothetical protein S40288_07972 [Stachybotrys chartarum IBT 40288]
MNEDTLGQDNRKRLQAITTRGLEHRKTPQELLSILASAVDDAARHDAALLVLASLSSRELSQGQHETALDSDQLVELIQTNLLRIPSYSTEQDATRQSLIAEAALACIKAICSSEQRTLDNSALLSIIPYTDPADPWTTPVASHLAQSLLGTHLTQEMLSDFVTDTVLQGYLRPLFAKASSSKVTASGRPAQFPDNAASRNQMSEAAPWKKAERGGYQAVASFHWAVKTSSEALISSQWPLFTPPLFTVAEDADTSYRRRGLETLSIFIDKFSNQKLQTTGIGNIIQEVVFPTLMFLPSITPESESTSLLRPAYRALLTLAKSEPDRNNPTRQQLLHKLLREGVFAGFHHASEFPLVVQTLMEHAADIIGQLGLAAVKHLQHLWDIFSAILTDPFVFTRPQVVIVSIAALKATLESCWPRMLDPAHAERVTSIVAICWLNLHDQDSVSSLSGDEKEQITYQLKELCEGLHAIWEANHTDMNRKVTDTLQQHPQLVGLFPKPNLAS